MASTTAAGIRSPSTSRAGSRSRMAWWLRGVLGLAIWWWICSWVMHWGLERVLSRALQVPVVCQNWHLGWNGSQLTGVVVRTPLRDGSGLSEFVRMERVSSDLSWRMILRGEFSPREITLVSPRAVIRQDHEGRFLDAFPFLEVTVGTASFAPLRITIEDGEMVAEITGQPPIAFGPYQSVWQRDHGAWTGQLSLDHESWGHFQAYLKMPQMLDKAELTDISACTWVVEASHPAASFGSEYWSRRFGITDPDVRIGGSFSARWEGTLDLSDWRKAWDTVRAGGGLPGSARVRWDDLTIQHAKNGTILTDGRGLIRYQDHIVTLSECNAALADGVVSASAEIQTKTGVGTGKITGKNLAPDRLPVTWTEAAPMEGRCSGHWVWDGLSVDHGYQIHVREGAFDWTDANLLGQKTDPIHGELDPSRPLAVITAAAPEALSRWFSKVEVRVPPVRVSATITDGNLPTLLDRLHLNGATGPIIKGGRINARFHSIINVADWDELRKWEVSGIANFSDVRASGYVIRNSDLDFHLEHGVWTLSQWRGELGNSGDAKKVVALSAISPASGSGPVALPANGFRGSARWDMSESGAAEISLELREWDLSAGMSALALPGRGVLSGAFRVRVPWRKAGELSAWRGEGTVQLTKLGWGQQALAPIDGLASVADGRLTLRNLNTRWKDIACEATLACDLISPYAYECDFATGEIPFARTFGTNAKWWDAQISVRGRIRGDWQSGDWSAQGTGGIGGAAIAGAHLGAGRFDWETDPTRSIKIHGLEAKVGGGTLAGYLTFNFRGDKPGGGALQFTHVDFQTATATWLGRDLAISGPSNGVITLAIPNWSTWSERESIGLNVDWNAPSIVMRGFTVGNPKFVLAIDSSKITFSGTGILPEGAFRVSGDSVWGTGIVDASVFFPKTVMETLLVKRLGLPARWSPGGNGNFAVQIRGRTAPETLWTASRFEITNFGWAPYVAGEKISGEIRTAPDVIRGKPLQGTLWGGTWTGNAVAWKDTRTTGNVRLSTQRDLVRMEMTLEKAVLGRLVSAWPAAQGRLDGVFRGTVRADWTDALSVSADFASDLVNLGPLKARNVQFPLLVTGTRDLGSLRVVSPHWKASIADGNVYGKITMEPNRDGIWECVGDSDFAGVALGPLLASWVPEFQSVQGRLTGQVSLRAPIIVPKAGAGALTPDAPLGRGLQGHFHADLNRAQLGSFPVISQLAQILRMNQVSAFDRGMILGTLEPRGVRIEAINLQGPLMQLFARGIVFYNGEMDMELLVVTNAIIPETGERLLRRIPVIGGLARDGAGLLQGFLDFLTESLLKFRIRGTIGQPRIQPDPSIRVNPQAVEFFTDALNLRTYFPNRSSRR